MKNFSMTDRVKNLTYTRKRTFSVRAGWDKICTDTYGDGGSISYWTVINIVTGKHLRPDPGQYPWTTPNDYTLQPGDVVMETGKFCGKDMTPAFYCRTEDESAVTAWLGIGTEPIRMPATGAVVLGYK